MNEPKRRGRPPKAKVEGAGITMSAPANPDPRPFYEMSRTPSGLVVVEHSERLKEAAQAYAMRVWNGQSTDVKREEKVRRVKLALEGQNLPFEGVELP